MSEAPEYKARVLVVDDDQAVALTLSQYLAIWGYQVVTADSVDAARVRLQTETELDVVMLDIKMPGASGVEFLPELKRGWPDLEVVFLTAYATLETAVEAVRHGASDFLLKPLSDMERQLLPVLERCLEHRRLVQSNRKLQAEVQEANRRLQAANRDLKRSLATSDTLLKTAQSVAGMTSAKALLDLARDSLQYGLQIERGLVVARPAPEKGWAVARQVGLDGLAIEGRALDGQVLEAGRVQCVEGRAWGDLPDWAWIYPMQLGSGEVLGAIVAFSAGQEPRKEHEDTGLRILAAQIAPALKLLGGSGGGDRRSSAMEVQEGNNGEISVLRIKGEVDGEAMAHLEKRIETIFERRNRRIVLNLGEIRYLGSSALEVLLRIEETLDRRGGAFRICRATEPVRRILAITGLARRLAVDETEEESVERIRNALCRPGAQFLGDYLVEKQVLLPGQLREALQQQMTQRTKNEAVKSLGMILIERGFLDRQKLQQHLLGYWTRRLGGRA